MTATNRIERYISELEMDNFELQRKLRNTEAKVDRLLKWLYLSNESRVMLESINPSTIEFCFTNKYPIDKAYKVQTELNEVRSWLGDLDIEHELNTIDDVINARKKINRAISERAGKH